MYNSMLTLRQNGFVKNKKNNSYNCRVLTHNGRLTAQESRVITEASERFGDGSLLITARMVIEICNVTTENTSKLLAFLKEHGLETSTSCVQICPIVVCKGDNCRFGVIDTYHLADELSQRLSEYYEVVLPHKFKIAVSGCPNNCSKSSLNDLGIMGQWLPATNREDCRDGGNDKLEEDSSVRDIQCEELTERAAAEQGCGFRVSIGGRWGKKIAVARDLGMLFTSEAEVLEIAEKVVLFYRERGLLRERLSDTIERVGFEHVREELFSDELIRRKAEILAKPIKS